MGWIEHLLKIPEQGDRYAIIRVDEDGNTELIRYLSPAVPEHEELIQQILDGR